MFQIRIPNTVFFYYERNLGIQYLGDSHDETHDLLPHLAGHLDHGGQGPRKLYTKQPFVEKKASLLYKLGPYYAPIVLNEDPDPIINRIHIRYKSDYLKQNLSKENLQKDTWSFSAKSDSASCTENVHSSKYSRGYKNRAIVKKMLEISPIFNDNIECQLFKFMAFFDSKKDLISKLGSISSQSVHVGRHRRP
jgi:hypothetical protein